LPWSAFSNQSYWISGNTLHICGTYTGTANSSAITTLGGGTGGNPITIKFENNAILQAPYWSVANGAIYCSNPYITIDGGSNGIIQNTANGTALAYHQLSSGILSGSACGNFTVQNLTIRNLYIRTEASNDSADDGTGIGVAGDNILLQNNTIRDISTGIGFGRCNQSHIDIYNNNITFSNHFITGGITGSNCVNNDVKIHGNDIGGGSYIYDAPNYNYHHNGIMIFADNSSCANCSLTNLAIYNNYLHGIWNRLETTGSLTTGLIFIDDQPGNTIQGYKIFNNVFEVDAGDPFGTNNGLIAQTQTGGASGNLIANNTFIQYNGGTGLCLRLNNQSNIKLLNNVFQGCGYAPQFGGSTLTNPTVDYNIYYNTAGGWQYPGSNGFVGFSSWQAYGLDTYGRDGVDPKLDLTYHLQTGSSAIGNGSNLTSLGIAELNADKFGIVRPPSAPWDIGAYQYTGGGTPPTPVPGDLNLDHVINALDYSILNSHWLQNYPTADINTDGLVNTLDFAILKSNWGKTW
jgi:hypothetical protein